MTMKELVKCKKYKKKEKSTKCPTLASASSSAFFLARSSSRERGCTWETRNELRGKQRKRERENMSYSMTQHGASIQNMTVIQNS